MRSAMVHSPETTFFTPMLHPSMTTVLLVLGLGQTPKSKASAPGTASATIPQNESKTLREVDVKLCGSPMILSFVRMISSFVWVKSTDPGKC